MKNKTVRLARFFAILVGVWVGCSFSSAAGGADKRAPQATVERSVTGPYEFLSLIDTPGALREQPFSREEQAQITDQLAEIHRELGDIPAFMEMKPEWDAARGAIRVDFPGSTNSKSALIFPDRPIEKASTEERARIHALTERFLAAQNPEASEDSLRDLYDYSFARGKSVLQVGSAKNRPFILEEVGKASQALGLKWVLLDKPSQRELSQALVPNENFIPAPIDQHDDDAMKSVVERAAEYFKAHQGEHSFVVIPSLLNAYAGLAGYLHDRLESLLPKVVGNTAEQVQNAENKGTARELEGKNRSIYVPFRFVESADEAEQAFRDLQKEGVVSAILKPRKGGGSNGVREIRSPAEARQAWTHVHAWLMSMVGTEEGRKRMMDKYPGIMLEKMLGGPQRKGVEFDNEYVLQDGRIVFEILSDNPPMNEYKVEKATTFPSQAPKRLNDMMLRRGRQVLKAHGAKWGNRHVETMYTSEDGGKGIEDNPRMGGFFVFNATLAQTGYNLIQGGIRAMLGLPVRFERGTRPAVVEERIINPEFTGEIVAIRGLEEAKRIPGVTDIEIYKTVGDGVIAAPEHTSDWIGRVQTSARTYDEAMAIQMKALNTIEFDVEVDTPQGKKIKTSKAAFDHEKAPVADQLAELNKKTTPR